jgi:hypothetical protein
MSIGNVTDNVSKYLDLQSSSSKFKIKKGKLGGMRRKIYEKENS